MIIPYFYAQDTNAAAVHTKTNLPAYQLGGVSTIFIKPPLGLRLSMAEIAHKPQSSGNSCTTSDGDVVSAASILREKPSVLDMDDETPPETMSFGLSLLSAIFGSSDDND